MPERFRQHALTDCANQLAYACKTLPAVLMQYLQYTHGPLVRHAVEHIEDKDIKFRTRLLDWIGRPD
ncbi:MAG: hypothetical protein ACRYGK_10045 [Janthinobacterium lividum]